MNNLQSFPFESLTLSPLKKCLVVGILNWFSHVFMGIYETINNNQEVKTQILF